MYQGSLFKKSLAYTRAEFDRVYILSAKYGLLELDQVIQPYEKTLNNMSVKARQEWSDMVKSQMRLEEIHKSHEHWFFTGEKYHEFFEGIKPLQGLSLGRQLQWFNAKLNQKKHKLL